MYNWFFPLYIFGIIFASWIFCDKMATYELSQTRSFSISFLVANNTVCSSHWKKLRARTILHVHFIILITRKPSQSYEVFIDLRRDNYESSGLPHTHFCIIVWFLYVTVNEIIWCPKSFELRSRFLRKLTFSKLCWVPSGLNYKCGKVFQYGQ